MSERYVYFIRPVGRGGPIKIGCSALPRGRLLTLMTMSPIPLEIAAMIPGDLDLERRLQGIFSDSHSHCEWFHASPRLLDLVSALADGAPISSLIDLSAPIVLFRARQKRVLTDDFKRYMRYGRRLRRAFLPLWASDGRGKYAPNDVDQIMARWSRRNGRQGITPTPAEFRRLESVIENPEWHAVTESQKWPELGAAAA